MKRSYPSSAAFNPSKLKPGDEVGVTWRSLSGQVEIVSRVIAVEDDGRIVVKGQYLPFWPNDGREIDLVINGVATPSPSGVRLCVPTDGGRAESLRGDIEVDLELLASRLHDIPLGGLRKIDVTIKALLDQYPLREAIDIPSKVPI